jgi:allantoin racemase
MRLLYINPNSTAAMTDGIIEVARATQPDLEITGWTNANGPPAIQGPEDGEAAIAGLLGLLPAARTAQMDAIIIACFDDTGLAQMRGAAHCPVIGIGQAAYHMAALLGHRFSVVTTLDISVPVIAENLRGYGFDGHCSRIRASGLGVLEVEAAGPAAMQRLSDELMEAEKTDGVTAAILGCAGMAPVRARLQARSGLHLIDGVASAAGFAVALAQAAR